MTVTAQAGDIVDACVFDPENIQGPVLYLTVHGCHQRMLAFCSYPFLLKQATTNNSNNIHI